MLDAINDFFLDIKQILERFNLPIRGLWVLSNRFHHFVSNVVLQVLFCILLHFYINLMTVVLVFRLSVGYNRRVSSTTAKFICQLGQRAETWLPGEIQTHLMNQDFTQD